MNVSLNGPCATNLDAIVSELSAMGWMPYSSGLPEDSYINDVSYGQILLYGDKVAVSSLYPHLTVLVQADHAPASGDTPDIASFEESFFDLVTVPSNPPQVARAIAEAAGALEEECRRGTVFRFRGDYFFLSNMYPLDEGLTVDGLTFESSESAYQALKTLDPKVRELVSKMGGKEAKRHMHEHGQLVRPDWGHVMRREMERVLAAKFTQTDALRTRLLSTRGMYLLEGNTWHDNIWGRCCCEECVGAPSLNLLGKSLMRIRAMLDSDDRRKDVRRVASKTEL